MRQLSHSVQYLGFHRNGRPIGHIAWKPVINLSSLRDAAESHSKIIRIGPQSIWAKWFCILFLGSWQWEEVRCRELGISEARELVALWLLCLKNRAPLLLITTLHFGWWWLLETNPGHLSKNCRAFYMSKIWTQWEISHCRRYVDFKNTHTYNQSNSKLLKSKSNSMFERKNWSLFTMWGLYLPLTSRE